MEILGTLRRKYRSFLPKDRSVVDPESGEIISSLDSEGREVLDTTPIAPPVNFNQQPSMVEYVRNLVRSEKLRMEAEEAGMETFEESEDFDVDDDVGIFSQWENEFDPPLSEVREVVEQERQARSSRAKSDKLSGVEPDAVMEPAQPAKSAEQPTGVDIVLPT